ncbi:LAQU0S06e02278g1_1 [Lachancea quebecensis]|uniref:LAQU0S06e02278g1_1 n=1 Tax=Lachancea quebecensis TaxID=1654605 RepID=A0A0P1KS52_9SACH|nr:LAQU0S06e02278g1_1 [Lachancea quebecensis]
MEGPKIGALCPLYLFSDSHSEERCLEVDPSEITKGFLNTVLYDNFGVESAIESCVVYYENRSFNLNKVFCLENDNDIAQFKAQFEALRIAKIGVALMSTTPVPPQKLDDIQGKKKEQTAGSVSIPVDQLNSLIQSIQKLEISLNKSQQRSEPPKSEPFYTNSALQSKTIHYQVICDGCHPNTHLDASSSSSFCTEDGYIKGPRFKCLYCYNYDLCSGCVAKGVETGTHQKYHNLIKINTPDGEINKIWSFMNTTPNQEEPAKFGARSSEKDVIIDIPDHNARVFDFFSKIKTEEQLAQLINHHERYESLLAQVGGDDATLQKAVDLLLSPSKTNSLDASIETAHEEEDLIDVQMGKRDHVISFKLNNRGPRPVPSGLRLVFQYFEPGNANPVKCTLHMGPHEFQRDSYKTLNFNCRGLIENFSLGNPCKIDLVDQDDDVIFTGSSSGGPEMCLKQPIMFDIQQSVYSEAREVPDLEAEYVDEQDIISNTVTNEDSQHASRDDSELDDYDFLSDSDIEG